MKSLAFSLGLGIGALGALGMLVPSGAIWLAQRFVTPGAIYAAAALRIAFGLILISAAPASRRPRALRILGYVLVILGIGTAFAGLLGMEYVRASVDWWLQQGSGILRLSALVVLALGAFIAYACAPVRRGGEPLT